MNESGGLRRGAAVEPREIRQEDDDALSITWGDGRVCRYRAADLRRLCPCAACVNEFTGERMLRPETVAENLTIQDVQIVGRYALNFRWSDNHDAGIYSFRLLREICEES